MKKIKILLSLALIFSLASCSNDTYTSVRHSQGEENKQEEPAVTENDEQAKEKSEDKEENKNEEKDKKESLDGVEVKVEDTVNMRLAPSVNSAVVGEVNPEDEILNLGETEGWTRVTVNGKTGYVKSDLLIKK